MDLTISPQKLRDAIVAELLDHFGKGPGAARANAELQSNALATRILKRLTENHASTVR